MPTSPKASTSGLQSPTAAAAAPNPAPIVGPASPTPIAPPSTTASSSSISAAFAPLPQHATNPHFQDLMARIRRAEKFGGAVSEADRNMYRQFKFGTFKAPAAKKGGAGGAGGVPKTTASPAGKSGAVAGAGKKGGAGKAVVAGLEAAAAAGKKKGGLLDGISDEDRLARLKRAYKFGVESTPEIKALETWYLGKFGEPFSLSKQ